MSTNIFTTMSLPLEFEARHIQEYLSTAEKEYQAFEAEFAQACSASAGLLHRQAEHRKNNDDHKTVLSPSRRLPADILYKIFSLYPGSAAINVQTCFRESVVRDDSFDTRKGPWVLSQVCKSWRSVALAFPRLWSCITVFHHGKKYNILKLLEKLDLILSRYSTTLLSIHIACATLSLFDALMDVLAPIDHQWHDFEIIGALLIITSCQP
jgi:hypothetical protein